MGMATRKKGLLDGGTCTMKPPPFELRPVSSLLTFLKTVLFQRAFGGLITVALKLFLLGIFIALYSYAFYTGYVLI